MGEVWEARDETLDRPVAVKVISLLADGGSRGGEARARFLREARITARLQHPHIVTVHDLGESGPENGNAPFLVMELVRVRDSTPSCGRAPSPASPCRQPCSSSTAHRSRSPSSVTTAGSGAGWSSVVRPQALWRASWRWPRFSPTERDAGSAGRATRSWGSLPSHYSTRRWS
ncbi:hypothetical protein ABZ686_12140 [Streptomyces sp. NPDC006992]|uniref:hypothetical protein n=1 Tax=Streptomyces sp. NPDC006992 TaxID=3155601 RepID=UPI003401A1E3